MIDRMNKRLDTLVRMVESGTADSFAHYALALEYRKDGQFDQALKVFNLLRSKDPAYLPMYLMAGQILVSQSQPNEARDWLTAGIGIAQQQGNAKALSELQAELASTQE